MKRRKSNVQRAQVIQHQNNLAHNFIRTKIQGSSNLPSYSSLPERNVSRRQHALKQF